MADALSTFAAPLVRLSDWPERLHAFVESRRLLPFAWGANDCCLFAADAVLALTGQDIAQARRSTYTTARGAMRVARSHGGVRALAAASLPTHPGRPAHAPRGSVVCAAIGRHHFLGLAMGDGRWCCPGAAGLVWRPMADVVTAFTV